MLDYDTLLHRYWLSVCIAKKFVKFLHRCSPGNSLTLSELDTFEGSLDSLPFSFFIPFGGLLEKFIFLDRSDGVELLSLLGTCVDASAVLLSTELLAVASLRSDSPGQVAILRTCCSVAL